jgi:hypothetical protein
VLALLTGCGGSVDKTTASTGQAGGAGGSAGAGGTSNAAGAGGGTAGASVGAGGLAGSTSTGGGAIGVGGGAGSGTSLGGQAGHGIGGSGIAGSGVAGSGGTGTSTGGWGTGGSGTAGSGAGPSCAPTVIGADPCDCAGGPRYYWDGNSCEVIVACCPETSAPLYATAAECANDHASCPAVECWTVSDCPVPDCAPCANGSSGSCGSMVCSDAHQCIYTPGPGCGTSTCPAECSYGCTYSDKLCGQGQDYGSVTCLTAPASCPAPTGGMVCACDGNVYANQCQALSSGHDLSQLGNCPLPEGTFYCGDHFCQKGTEYCVRYGSDIGGWADGYDCKPIPSACNAPGGAACSCFAGETCGGSCTLDDLGNVTLMCFGG